MSNNKSLGSSPLGLVSGRGEEYQFIPDLGMGKKEEKAVKAVDHSMSMKDSSVKNSKVYSPDLSQKQTEKSKPEKQITSYNLEVALVERLKEIADEHGIYYSRFVSDAIKKWIDIHDY